MTWYGALDAFFTAQGYHFTASLYGTTRNDYMGVALAFPLSFYELVESDVSCLATKQRWGRAPKAPWPSAMQRRLDAVLSFLALVFWTLSLSMLWLPLVKAVGVRAGLYKYPPKWPKKTAYQDAQNKWNRFIYHRLAVRGAQGAEFGVATYHMPCVFWVSTLCCYRLPAWDSVQAVVI